MPKLDATHILSRLSQRLEQLQAGEEIAAKEIAAKEIRSLLTPEQQQELEDAWAEQQKLRKGNPASRRQKVRVSCCVHLNADAAVLQSSV